MLYLFRMDPRGNIYNEKKRGPKIDPWGTPYLMEAGEEEQVSDYLIILLQHKMLREWQYLKSILSHKKQIFQTLCGSAQDPDTSMPRLNANSSTETKELFV